MARPKRLDPMNDRQFTGPEVVAPVARLPAAGAVASTGPRKRPRRVGPVAPPLRTAGPREGQRPRQSREEIVTVTIIRRPLLARWPFLRIIAGVAIDPFDTFLLDEVLQCETILSPAAAKSRPSTSSILSGRRT